MASDTRARMIETTARLLQQRGYYGTSLSDILSESAAPRGSLYFHFPGGKEQLAIEATRVAIDQASKALDEAIRTAPIPGKAVRLFADGAANLMVESDFTFGCPVTPVILDATGGIKELEELCKAALERWTAAMRDAFTGAGMTLRRAERLALLAVAAIEGALVIARAQRDEGALHQVGEELEMLIDAALPARRRRPKR